MSSKTIKITINELSPTMFCYNGIDSNTGEAIFSNCLSEQVGICEFIGAVHGLMYLKKNQLYGEVLVKNKYIKSCIENKKYKHEAKTEKGIDLLRRTRMFLTDMKSSPNIYLYE